ncbi:hypothetical protein BLA29_005025 [Euroglyphus maynei]|uniref:Flavin-containing monooxygenase n=1 Tax=Euroglyphus maynei TaxID=6958 RepID=A0A1Y3B022_EURMA|nr:hypothetical protein BLA29_005025 [Euroglyphus maynei]
MQLNSTFNHEDYQLKPKHRVLSQHIMVNDTLPNRILSGTIKVKGNIDHFTENGVVFNGENTVTPCDSVIMATGYKVHFPFISETLIPVHKNQIRLYKYQFAPHLKHPHTLAFISLAQPIGALLPIGELQARWFSLLMTNKLKLPDRKTMELDVDAKVNYNKRFYESERHTIQCDWINFMDEISQQVGCRPPVWKYLFTDFKLFSTMMFGPCVPYQYRLVGPNAWPGARQAILTASKRIQAPLKTNPAIKQSSESGKIFKNFNMIHFIILLSLVTIFFFIILILKAVFN